MKTINQNEHGSRHHCLGYVWMNGNGENDMEAND